MGCKGCTVCTTNKDGSPAGCGSNGNCATGSCNRLNTYDWLSNLDIFDSEPFDIVEVSFKNGARKNFFRVPEHIRTITGDWVVVETGNGYDIGTITLSGDLVRLQMKKKRSKEADVLHNIIRRANERDLEKLDEARQLERPAMVKARAIARTLGLEMKIGDVEYQGDKRKATFYYTADGRVDFRELIRHYAKEFKIKIEMRQIGARQESARIGGIGSCGRELCCSTWLSDFKSVSTSAARYQNLAINQAKLSGQCGRLKCCLNYELDTYLEALEDFPEGAEKMPTKVGTAILIKTDIFQKIMYYVIEGERGKVYPIPVSKVNEILAHNAKGEGPYDFSAVRAALVFADEDENALDFADVTGEIELPEDKRRKKKKRNNRNRNRNNKRKDSQNKQGQNSQKKESGTQRGGKRGSGNQKNNRNNRGGQNKNEGGQQKQQSNRSSSKRRQQSNKPNSQNKQQDKRQNTSNKQQQNSNKPQEKRQNNNKQQQNSNKNSGGKSNNKNRRNNRNKNRRNNNTSNKPSSDDKKD